jgi:hypothetical protein
LLAAASTSRDGFPELFQLALRILGADRPLPAKLADHLSAVMVQAFDILTDPAAISQNTQPEAIQLALELRRSAELRQTIEPSLRASMTAESARKILALEQMLEATR